MPFGTLRIAKPLAIIYEPKQKKMREYKVETLIYYSKITTDSNHIAKSSQKEIQEKLNEYSKQGYSLTSTDATHFGFAVYIYLYFEKEV